jgi:hypothetical protein
LHSPQGTKNNGIAAEARAKLNGSYRDVWLPGNEATALSNHHRVAVSLTAIEAPFVLCRRTGDVAHRPFEGWYSGR